MITIRFGLIVACLLCSMPAMSDTLRGVVVSVHDGDTITVLDSLNHQHKIRLMGIDAPERGQPYSKQSRDALRAAVMHQAVMVELSKQSSYNRQIGQVFVGNRDINLEQVSAGMAWHYRQFAQEQQPVDRQRYAEAEVTARESHAGLWADPTPKAPWEWRKERRSDANQ